MNYKNMNKEQKKFKEVIKKRRTRALRKKHPRVRGVWVEVKPPVLQITAKKSWWDRIKEWLKRK